MCHGEFRNTVMTQYYINRMNGCLNNQGSFFTIVNTFLHCSASSPLLTYNVPAVLANDFAQFFENKILKIHNFLTSSSRQSNQTASAPKPAASVHLT